MSPPASLRIGYLGPATTNTHAAALALFGSTGGEFFPFSTVTQIFDAVQSGRLEHGVVPIENSTEGMVRETLDDLLSFQLVIDQEYELAIRHCLLAGPQFIEDAAPVEVILSHPQALAQCRNWLDQHYPGVERRATASTAAAAQEVLSLPHSLAIASPLTAESLNLRVVADNIADRKYNTTRFFGIAQADAAPTGKDKTSLVLTAPHERGALRKILEIFDEAEVNLTRIESRPLPDRLWEYAFIVEVEGHRQEPHISQALHTLQERGSLMKLLGSYPRGAVPPYSSPPPLRSTASSLG